MSAAAKKDAVGHPERWAPVLADGATAADLRAAFAGEKLLAERTLADVAELLGLEAARAGIGFNYADKDDARYVALRFRLAKRPAHETPATGDPRFEMGGHSPEVDVSAGFPVQIGCAVRNAGGASRGLRVVVSGDALERGLLALDEIELVVGSPSDANRIRVALEGGRASFPDLEIPAGRTLDLRALMSNPRKMVELMHASQVHANLFGRGLAKGEGTLRVAFVPTSAPRAEHACDMIVRVQAAPHRPLRAPAETQARGLRALEGRGTLFALVSMDLERAEAAAVATRMLARWDPMLARGEAEFGVFRSAAGVKPRTGRAAWSAIPRNFAGERLVFAQLAGTGFSFGGSILPREVAGDPELPTLALWTTGERDARLANELMDEIMTSHRGAQAMVGRWDWSPALGVDSTPYEIACGIHGQCTLRRSWLQRWLRGVAPGTLWLGEALRSHVPAAPARITIEENSIAATEATLAAILPSQTDWRAAVARLYGR